MLSKTNLDYNIIIEKGHSTRNDAVIDFLTTKISGRYLDVGCNTGWLLSLIPKGIGVDASIQMVKLAKTKNLTVCYAWGEALPFVNKAFNYVVLSCILEQCKKPYKIILEALRVGKKVIGINPYPNSPWGKNSPSPWVKSIINPTEFSKHWNAYVERFDKERWYFEINK